MVEYNLKPVLLTYIINLHFRVCDYIKYGWDIFLIDPDGGANVQQKLQAKAAHTDTVLLQSIPKPNDKHWSKQICDRICEKGSYTRIRFFDFTEV